ncbi:MAG: aspartate kinase [Candidatus Kapabacteria bacterium]|nr:aspartate kinase [Ignavibacteriota bacterium]MCW5883417.1 aspartate kinase [Candidatus Kapabacteria bacterium]
MKILKFGGTSVQSADSIRKSVDCILRYGGDNPVVVLSALAGTTNSLIEAINLSLNEISESVEIINQLEFKHLNVLKDLCPQSFNNTSIEIKNIFDDIKRKLSAIEFLGEITPFNFASVSSYGEILSTKIFLSYLNEIGIDSSLLNIQNYLITDSNFKEAKIDFNISLCKFKDNTAHFLKNGIKLTQGFIASDLKNRTTILGRGGSDYTSAVIGNLLKKSGLDIDEIQIWTDVSGILSADPRMIPAAKTIKSISAKEVRIMSYLGAKVLHPDTIKPALEADIRVSVRNTFIPDGDYTVIQNNFTDQFPKLNTIINLREVNELNFDIPGSSNSWEIANHINNIAFSAGCKPISINISEESITSYYFNSIDVFFDTKYADFISFQKVFLLAITGTLVNKKLFEVINALPENASIISINNNAIFIKSTFEFSIENIDLLHNRLIQNFD